MASMVDNHFHGWNPEALAVVICSSLSIYSVLELMLTLLLTFQSYRGLYFWSLMIASFGIIPYSIGYTMEYFRLYQDTLALGIAIDTTGWSLMVTGQAFVLYSRLHIVFSKGYKKLLRTILAMIIFNGVCLHGTTSLVAFKSNLGPKSSTKGWERAYNVVEPVQMSIFAAQELALSGLYIWKALDMLMTSDRVRSRGVMRQLFFINVIIILLDIGLLATEFAGKHVVQQTLKGVVYSLKLKLELSILNKLVELSASNVRRHAVINTNEFLDPSKTKWDVSNFVPGFSNVADKHPQWISDLEKSRVRGSLTDIFSDHKDSNIQVRETDADTIMPITPSQDRPRTRSPSHLMYAEAIRRISMSN
ncbi:unnamed protein product [Periconia digitata]|uniref:DUF7703 domain-containing protein n=1 Tax=Periconia digitata TaxID=1303443 RepID=A0A9W4UGZ4_9PLEO|nr:unnamed protein product [Periconia digitata]